jgi:hypothetical protein
MYLPYIATIAFYIRSIYGGSSTENIFIFCKNAKNRNIYVLTNNGDKASIE